MSTIKPDVTRISGIIAITGGVGSWTLPVGMADEVTMVGCKPASDSAIYDLYIKDIGDDWELFRRDNNKGTYSELLSTALPLWGDNVVCISGATVDGYYRLRLVYR